MADWLEVQNINHDNLNVEGKGRNYKSAGILYYA